MRKLLFMITAVAFLFTACEKDNQKQAVQNTQDGATIEFKIDQTDFGYKNTVPMCDDELSMDYVMFTVLDSLDATTSYKSMIYYVGGEMLTQVIKLPVGTYHLTSFVVYNDNGTPDDDNDDIIVRAAPLPNSEYWDLMQFKLNLEFTVDAFYKKQYEIDVLCYEELFYEEFGFTWFQFHDVRIERQCFFGDICVMNLEDFAGSEYELQEYGIQMDLPAIFEIRVWKEGDDMPLRTFSNLDWLGEGQCLQVYWPNRLDVEEQFAFQLMVWLPVGDGQFDWVQVHIWYFFDGDCPEPGEDGVVEFVLGDCILGGSDFVFPPYYEMFGK